MYEEIYKEGVQEMDKKHNRNVYTGYRAVQKDLMISGW